MKAAAASAEASKAICSAPSKPDDSLESAKLAGLRYVSDEAPGFRRRKAGRGFVYTTPEGKVIRDPEHTRRIKSLAIPPAWRDVWICPVPNGHLQATGRDAKGRKQHRYHPRWREVRDRTKYEKMIEFARQLPAIRRQVERDLRLPGLPRQKVLATVVRLLETGMIRVGNEEYARQNNSFGVATLRTRHVNVFGPTLRFEFRGKSGVQHAFDLTDRRLARIIKQCQELPGHELFQYLDDRGERCTIDSADVNDYLRAIAGEDISSKDFRTWAGTVLAFRALTQLAHKSTKKQFAHAVESVAKQLGNTVAVCRKCYIHPAVFEAYADGSLKDNFDRLKRVSTNLSRHAFRQEEAAVLALLKKHLKTNGRNLKAKLRQQLSRSLARAKSATPKAQRQIEVGL
jgi:DNA topoisomerase-1